AVRLEELVLDLPHGADLPLLSVFVWLWHEHHAHQPGFNLLHVAWFLLAHAADSFLPSEFNRQRQAALLAASANQRAGAHFVNAARAEGLEAGRRGARSLC